MQVKVCHSLMEFSKKYLFVSALVAQLVLIAVYVMLSERSTDKNDLNYKDAHSTKTSQLNDSYVEFGVTEVVGADNNTTRRLSTNVKSEPAVFQKIDDKPAWVHSVFFDHMAAQNGRPLVRVFGLARKTYFKWAAYCTLTALDGTNLTATGVIVSLPESHNTEHQPIHVECNLGNARPTHVSVSLQTKETPTNRLQIIYPGPRIRNFTVCYSVLHSKFNMTTQLIESIEMNRILGAEHFIVYNYSISPEVDQILRRYQEDGLVTVFKWPVPTKDVHYFAQVLALNDCFYRNRNTSRFVVVVDTDELMVPRNQLNWMTLIDTASPGEADISQFRNSSKPTNTGQKLTGCFIVKSSYFSTNPFPNWKALPSAFDEDEKKNIIKYKIYTFSQLARLNYILPVNNRCKYIARPEFVYYAGIHYVMGFVGGKACLAVHENLALLHHYRYKYTDKPLINDTSVMKFKQSLYPRVIEQLQRFPGIFNEN